jgi:predicted enzyme related to lactoylglutathione lyase
MMVMIVYKESIDLGKLRINSQALFAFYHEILGLEKEGGMEMQGGSRMQQLYCGTTILKIVGINATASTSEKPAEAVELLSGLAAAVKPGYQYFTISVANLEEVVEACLNSGRNVLAEPIQIRPGVIVAIVDDPDGNWAKFLAKKPGAY